MLAILMVGLITLSGLNVTYADVVYTPESVIVTFHYSLEPLQKINTFLFGCDDISYVMKSLLNCSCNNFEIERIDSSKAIFRFNISDEGEYYYFSGVNLTIPVTMKVNINDSITFLIENSTRIPEMYVFK